MLVASVSLEGMIPFRFPLPLLEEWGNQGASFSQFPPALKRQGAKSRCRVYELEGYQNVWFVPCRMNHYLKVSQDILKIYLRYVSYEDLHIYSIDEVFIDITSYLRLYKCDAYTLAKQMMCDILKETGIPSTCGIGPNLLLAKVALDIEAKKAVNGIAQWSYTDVKTKLWPLTPLSKMWGIGIQLEKRLNRMGMYCVGDIAQYPLDFLKREFGVLGEQLYQHSHGIDESDLHDVYQSRYPTIGGGQVLMRDYYAYDIKTILLEQVEEVMFRLRKKNLYCEVVHLAIGYSKSVRGGFSRQTKLSQATDLTESVFEACLRLFEANYTGQPIRKVSISLGGLVERGQTQLSLFEDVTKKQQLSYAMDEIRIKHGKNALLRAISYEKGATGRYRNTLMGGHQAE